MLRQLLSCRQQIINYLSLFCLRSLYIILTYISNVLKRTYSWCDLKEYIFVSYAQILHHIDFLSLSYHLLSQSVWPIFKTVKINYNLC